MSLILDALRRSEAERRRGQPPALLDSNSTPRAPVRPLWPTALGGLFGGLLLAGGLAWWLRPLPTPAAMPPPAPITAEPSVPLVIAAPPTPAATPRTVSIASPQAIVPEALPSASITSESVVADDLPISDLSPIQRATLPPLRLSVHVYAEVPTQRFAIVDGQRLREGDVLANDLQLLEIHREGLRFRWLDRTLWLPR